MELLISIGAAALVAIVGIYYVCVRKKSQSAPLAEQRPQQQSAVP